MLLPLETTYNLPSAADFVGPIVAPILTEIFTKFIPVAGSVLVGMYAIKRLSGAK